MKKFQPTVEIMTDLSHFELTSTICLFGLSVDLFMKKGEEEKINVHHIVLMNPDILPSNRKIFGVLFIRKNIWWFVKHAERL